jgi:hypothetical protein
VFPHIVEPGRDAWESGSNQPRHARPKRRHRTTSHRPEWRQPPCLGSLVTRHSASAWSCQADRLSVVASKPAWYRMERCGGTYGHQLSNTCTPDNSWVVFECRLRMAVSGPAGTGCGRRTIAVWDEMRPDRLHQPDPWHSPVGR